MPDANDICSTCENTRQWHDDQPEGSLRHGFNEPISFTQSDAPRRPQAKTDAPQAMPADPMIAATAIVRKQSDPVLRLLLMRAGVIHQEDLDLMEQRMIRHVASGKHMLEIDDARPSTGSEKAARADGRDRAGDHATGDFGSAERGLRSGDTHSLIPARPVGSSAREPSRESGDELRDRPSDDQGS